MKIKIIGRMVVMSLLLVLTTSGHALANWYVTFGGGGGGETKRGNLRGEGGMYTTNQSVNYLFGFGLSFTLGRDDTPSDLIEHPVPHEDFTRLGKRDKGEEVGLYGKFGIEVVNRAGVFLMVYGGATWAKEIELAQSNVTRRYYQESEKTKTYGLIGGGIGYFPRFHRFCFQMGYDNRMGINGMVGFNW
jgi:hypothetical protein